MTAPAPARPAPTTLTLDQVRAELHAKGFRHRTDHHAPAAEVWTSDTHHVEARRGKDSTTWTVTRWIYSGSDHRDWLLTSGMTAAAVAGTLHDALYSRIR